MFTQETLTTVRRTGEKKRIHSRDGGLSFLIPAQLLCWLLKMGRAWEVVPCWMACDVLWLNWRVKMKSPSVLLLPTTAATSGFCQNLGSFPAQPEEGGKVRGRGGR